MQMNLVERNLLGSTFGSGPNIPLLLVPKLQFGNVVLEAPASRDGDDSSKNLHQVGSQTGVWEPAQPAKPHPQKGKMQT